MEPATRYDIRRRRFSGTMKKLVFFPWNAILASEAQKMTSWVNTGDYKTDHYTGAVLNTMKSRIVGEIYVFGHCSPGSLTISNDANQHLQ